MADDNTPPQDPSSGKDGEKGTDQTTQEEATAAADQTTEPQPGVETRGSTSSHRKPQTLKKSTIRRKSSLKPVPKPATEASVQEQDREEDISEEDEDQEKQEKLGIPIDFYYDTKELQNQPKKSDDTLPDDLMILYHSFGYPCQMRNNLHALSDNRLIFSAGCYLQVLYLDSSGYRYKFFRTMGGGSVGAMTVHPTGKYFAVGEKGNSPNVSIYSSDGFRLYRILRSGTTSAYTSLCFNESGDLLASQGADPDHMLTVWNWIQETILLRCKAFSQEVNHVSFNRELKGALCTSGSRHIKFWNMAQTFTGLKLQGQVGRFGRTPISDIEGFLEFPDGKVLTGSDWGYLLLWDENLIKLQIGRRGGRKCHEGQVMHMMMVEGEIITAGKDGFVRSWNLELIDVLEVAEESGLVEIDAMNEVLISQLAQLYYLTQPPRAHKVEAAANADMSEEDEAARHTWYCQDGAGGIWQADLSFHLNALAPKRLLTFHTGPIVACVVSPLTYLVMTLGEDGTLRLFDFLKKKLLAVRQFETKGSSLVWIPLCVDNRCSTVLAGFSDGAIRRVSIDGSTTTVFGVNRMECQLKLLQVLKPHTATVTDIAYSRYGTSSPSGHTSSLATCSEDHTIFFFNVFSDNDYQPVCFVPLQFVPRHVIWSPDPATRDQVLITCDDGIVIEMIQPETVTTSDTLECNNVQTRAFKFLSVKSELLHQQEVDKEREIEEKREKEREENNKRLLDKGLETPSQQNLRIEAENAAAAAEQMAKEESEEPWAPFIPPIPSPILQTLYPEGGGKFWLMLGDYDAGYFYECQFPNPFQAAEKDVPVVPEETRPLRAIPLEEGEDDVITAFCFISDGTCVFLGLKNGRIRVQFLDTEFDLANQRMYWSMAVHDGTHGAIQDLKISHDEVFLLTVGQDGNFFVFTLLGDDMLSEVIKVDQAQVPAGLPEEAQIEDIPSDHYTLEQSKQRSDQELLLKMAEKRKQEKRIEIASLRTQFTHVVSENHELPARQRLTPDDFVMDPSLAAEAAEQKRKKLELLHKQLAWESEKADMGYKKIYDYYRKHVYTDYFCVRALNTDHVIHSFRIEKRHYRPSAISSYRSTAVRSDIFYFEDSGHTVEEDEAELARLLGASPAQIDDMMGASERTRYLLKKVHAKRLKRARRKLAWKRFMETKPADDVEDPHDVEAIQKARDTLGDRPLKSDSSYVVPDSYRLTMEDGGRRLDGSQIQLQRMQIDFNRRLLDLHEEKFQTMVEIGQCIQSLQTVHDHLDMAHYEVIPKCPAMDPDELPGGDFQLDATTEKRLRRQAKDKQRHRMGHMQQESKENVSQKSRRKSSLAIAKENLLRRLHTSEVPLPDSSLPVSARTPPIGSDAGSGVSPDRYVSTLEDQQDVNFQSPLWQELKAVEQIRLKYEQSRLIKEIEEKTMVFDIRHRQLRHEKFELDVMVKLGGLRVTTLQEEQLLLMECEHVEMEIQTRIDACLDQKVDLDKTLKQLQSQMNRLTKDTEENGKKDKALYVQLESIIGENNPFHDYLVKVYKKKIKRKTATKHHEDEDESDSSESDSESSESDEESDDDDDNVVHYDLNMCPANCSQEIYHQVIELREQRLDLDEQTTEMKKTRETLVKDIDIMSKKRQGLDTTLNKAQNELKAFQLEKQKRVNDLYAVCIIQLHQIQSLRQNGEFHYITNELLLHEEELQRLQNRIWELKDEKKEERKKTVERRKITLRLKHDKYIFKEKLAEMEDRCDKEMKNKFGKLVDLEVVESVVADSQVEDVRSRLLNVQRQSDQEMRSSCRQMTNVKTSYVYNLRLDMDYKLVEAAVRARALEMEKALDTHLAPDKPRCGFQQDSVSIPPDVQDLLDVVTKQRQIIKSLVMEIQYLQGGTPSSKKSI